MSYQYHEDVSLADVAFSAEASSPEELLADCGKATFEVMVSLKEVEPKEKKAVNLEADSFEKLVFAWIEELVYLKDAESMVFSKFEAKIERGKKWIIEGAAWGEKIDPKKHTLNVDVKAVTYHHFRVEEKDGKWTAHVVLDV